MLANSVDQLDYSCLLSKKFHRHALFILIIVKLYQLHRFLWLYLTVYLYQISLLVSLLMAFSVYTELFDLSFSWLANTGVPVCRSPQLAVTYEFVLASQAVSGMSCLIWMVCKMGGKWPYGCFLVGPCIQDFFKTAHCIFV